MTRWGDEKTLHFICLYRQYECLWNTRSPFYKNKLTRRFAYQSILQSFNDRYLDLKSVKTKIKNLRSVYHTELKKVRDSMRAGRDGPVYKPSLSWFDEMHAFLGDSIEDRHDATNETTSADVAQTGTSGGNNSELSTRDVSVEVEHITIEATLEPNLDPLHDSVIEVPLNSNSCIVTSDPGKSISGPQPSSANQRRIYRKKKAEDTPVLEALQRLETTVSNVMTSSQQPQTHHQNEDEFHLFALSVAAQLRQLPLHIAVATQSKIQSTLSEARLATIFSNTLSSPSMSIKTENMSD